MSMLNKKDILARLVNVDILRIVGEESEKENIDCYVVGGWVRDLLLELPSNDIDIVCVRRLGDTRPRPGIIVANKVATRIAADKVSIFENFGTVRVKKGELEVEFVGARKESYQRNSRKPIVEEGTLEDDLSRRDFTINAMAIHLNPRNYGELVDMFDGLSDMKAKIIKTPLDPNITYSDDPLRMLRAVRFASRFAFALDDNTKAAIKTNLDRINILSKERIAEELCKMLSGPNPAMSISQLFLTGLLEVILPAVHELWVSSSKDYTGHKDIFLHTLSVLNNVAKVSDNLWLRWAALLHDIGKPKCKKYIDGIGWTFRDHEFVGASMIPDIFASLKLPQNEKLDYVVKMVKLHMRPINLVEDAVTDSAVRRLLFDAGDDINDLMILCKADVTSRNLSKVARIQKNYDDLIKRMGEIEENDKIRNFQPPISGNEIMMLYNLRPSALVGELKNQIKDAILDGVIKNDYDSARAYLDKIAKEHGILAL